MKRLHVHLGVADLDASIRFYATLFGAEPALREADYAKWMLDEPRVNFAISTRGAPGLDHLGIQVESAAELHAAAAGLAAAGADVVRQEDAVCCYARSDKAWVADPQGVAWETFFSHGAATVYGEDRPPDAAIADGACCAPQPTFAPPPAPSSEPAPAAACGAARVTVKSKAKAACC